jgi:DnaJ-class molecular chaperone
MSPFGWLEIDPDAGDVCVFCNEYRGDHDDAACARFVSDDDLCDVCSGTGVLGDVRRSDYNGRKCQACAGQGCVESSSQAGEQA